MEEWKVGPREPDNEKLGKLLLELRNASDFSRTTVAHRLSLSSAYLRLIERGIRSPVRHGLCDILDVYQKPYTTTLDRVVIDEVSIEFTSRIKEARGDSRSKDSRVPPTLSRSTRVGRIVELLISVDSETLREVHEYLERSRENHGL